MGHVLGIRQWQRGSDGKLHGVHSFAWESGENVATCERNHPVPHSVDTEEAKALMREKDAMYAEMQRLQTKRPKGISDLPLNERQEYERLYAEHEKMTAALDSRDTSDCGCGFWAYFDLNPSEFRMGEKPIVGVIKGYGRTLLGSRGFRCEKAEIVGLHLAYEYVKPKPAKSEAQESRPDPAGWASVFGADYETGSPEALTKIAADEAELGKLYPGAVIYATLPALLAAHPPSKEEATSD